MFPLFKHLIIPPFTQAKYEINGTQYNVHTNPYQGYFVDVNGDNILDILVGGVGIPTVIPSDNLTYIPGNSNGLGQGDGTFDSAHKVVTQTGTYKSRGFIVADFNGDKKIDIASSSLGPNANPPPTGGEITVIMGDNSGDFSINSPSVYSGYPQSRGMVAVDYDHDTDLDILFTYISEGSGKLGILENIGNGTFDEPAKFYFSGTRPQYFCSGDLNNDGWSDFAVPSDPVDPITDPYRVFIHLNKKDGTLLPATTTPLPMASRHVRIADINGDGNTDIIASHPSITPTDGSGGFSILRGNGDGTFEEAQAYLALGDAANIMTGDFNGDGFTDIAIGIFKENKVMLFLNKQNSGTFIEGISLNTATITGLDSADVNGDGRTDFITTSLTGSKVYVNLALP